MLTTSIPSCALYQHPDGFSIKYSALSRSLECRDENDDFTFEVPIGPDGLISLGLALIQAGQTQTQTATTAVEDDSERDGAALGSDLINELLKLKGRPQSLAFQALHNKLVELAKVEHPDSAAGGFAVALVNVLEVGIANLPKAGDAK